MNHNRDYENPPRTSIDAHTWSSTRIMGKKNPPDERVVYVALKNVFKGCNAEVRQPKLIRKLIVNHQGQADVTDLVQAHTIEAICNTARVLLTEQIFESTLKAKMRFPEVFDVSPAQSAERETSEAEAARNEANAIQDVVKDHQSVNPDVIQLSESVEKERGEQCSSLNEVLYLTLEFAC
jgi:hypothetical protein